MNLKCGGETNVSVAAHATMRGISHATVSHNCKHPESSSQLPEGQATSWLPRKPLQPEKCRAIQKQFERRAGIQHLEYFIKILLVFAQAGHTVPAGPGAENATLIWISV